MTGVRLLRLFFCVFSLLLPCTFLIAQPSVVQMASAKTPDCIVGCSARSLKVSFAPSTQGSTLVAVLDETANFFVQRFTSCFDNFGHEWTPNVGSVFQSAMFFVAPQNPTGVNSLECKRTDIPGAFLGEGAALVFFELKGVEHQNVIEQQNPILFLCDINNVPSLLTPGISLFQADTRDATSPVEPDIITASSPGLTGAFNLIQTVSEAFGDGNGGLIVRPIMVATMDSFYQINSTPTQAPVFSSLQSGSSPGCYGITFSPAHIVDPYPDLMNGFNVAAATGAGADLLATLGRPINGIAADGVTQILVRIPADNIGDQVTFTVLDANGQPSVHPSEDGALGNPGDSSPNIIQPQISTFAVSTASGPYAFAVYRAPLDFPRAGAVDENARFRTISIEVLGNGKSQHFPLMVVRPPVAMIHGLWSNWKAWDNFAPLVTGANTVDPRFSILRVNYDNPVGTNISATDPPFFIQKLLNIRANSMGFGFNAPNVLSQMSQWLQNFRNGTNPAHIAVAAAQFDVVAHSMGGNITRTLLLTPGYAGNSNFGRGAIHKAITIDTPHLGTPIASLLLAPQNSCIRRWFASQNEAYAFRTATFNGNLPAIMQEPIFQVSGAVGDLGLQSDAIVALQGLNPNSNIPPVQTAMIAGVYTNLGTLDEGAQSFSQLVLTTACRNDALVQSLTSTGWPAIFAATGDPTSDGLVSVTSQLASLGNDAGLTFNGFLHSPDLQDLGFSLPSVLDANTAISSEVVFLLNTAIPSSPTFKPLGPSSQ